jgi:hypothetical protein
MHTNKHESENANGYIVNVFLSFASIRVYSWFLFLL